jgi:hypothetical protein
MSLAALLVTSTTAGSISGLNTTYTTTIGSPISGTYTVSDYSSR